MIEIGDKVISLFGDIGIVIEKLSLFEVLVRQGKNPYEEQETDLPYLFCRSNETGEEFYVCEYEAKKM